MQKRNNCYLGTLEASLPYTELFGSLSPVYEEEIQEPWLESNLGDPIPSFPLQNSDHSVLDAWELLQEYGDLNCHQDDFPELYDLCVNINDVCGKYESEKKGRTGPTLAELNGRRALSPLINPEMRRLHMEATDFDEPDFILFGSGLKEQTEINEPLKVVTCRSIPPYVGQHSYVENIKISSRNEQPDTFCKSTDIPDFGTERHCSVKREPVEQAVVKSQPLNPEPGDNEKQSLQEPKHLDECQVLDSSDGDRQHPGLPVKLEEREHTDRDTLMESENEDDEEDDEDIDSDDENISRRDKMLMAKGRRSEAEDWTPNPAKLVEIGKQLDRLNRVIGDLRPINQLPLNSRNKTRREKNKLASRACRLKKKAGHEANKIKLRGLEMENSLLLKVVESIKDAVVSGKEPISDKGVLKKVDLALGNCVAGKLTDFVDTVIKKAATGDSLKGFKHHIKE